MWILWNSYKFIIERARQARPAARPSQNNCGVPPLEFVLADSSTQTFFLEDRRDYLYLQTFLEDREPRQQKTLAITARVGRAIGLDRSYRPQQILTWFYYQGETSFIHVHFHPRHSDMQVSGLWLSCPLVSAVYAVGCARQTVGLSLLFGRDFLGGRIIVTSLAHEAIVTSWITFSFTWAIYSFTTFPWIKNELDINTIKQSYILRNGDNGLIIMWYHIILLLCWYYEYLKKHSVINLANGLWGKNAQVLLPRT